MSDFLADSVLVGKKGVLACEMRDLLHFQESEVHSQVHPINRGGTE